MACRGTALLYLDEEKMKEKIRRRNEREFIFGEGGGERASLCWKVPRLRPLVFLIGIM
jgi:hypothetical protein